MGRRGVRPRARRGPPRPALGRLRGLPLVPRDGARVLRGRRDRRAHEPRLRPREGRPRGAARRGRPLHGRGRRHDGTRRLADDRLPDARRAPLLRRDVLPARAQARDAELLAGAPGRLGGLQEPPPRPRAAGRRSCRRHQAGERPGALGRAADERPPERSRAGASPLLRPPRGRLRPGAEVPGRVDDRAPPPPPRRQRRRGGALDGAPDPRPHGRGRDVRRARRRLPPLLRGRPLARPALREDALRQRAARVGLSARVGRDGRGALPAA